MDSDVELVARVIYEGFVFDGVGVKPLAQKEQCATAGFLSLWKGGAESRSALGQLPLTNTGKQSGALSRGSVRPLPP